VTEWQKRIATWVETACRMEVMSPKPGNVSPGREYADSTVHDFLESAKAIAPELALADTRPLGDSILASLVQTRRVVSHNTNLGIVLLIAPLAAVPAESSLAEGIDAVLSTTTIEDSLKVYEAIRLAQPAGLGEVAEQDLREAPTANLRDCMKLAAARDMIARQYSNGFDEILKKGLSWLDLAGRRAELQPNQIALLAVQLLAEFGDSLIARKCGQETSDLVQQRAQEVLNSGWPERHGSEHLLLEFDAFLRRDGNRLNPGTTADLVAAILFAALREGQLVPDWKAYLNASVGAEN
jgi:triphosphoribosyl-dephospho-CoA synthase